MWDPPAGLHTDLGLLQIYALKCLADSLCKSRQAHATLTFKSMAWKSAFESHCKIPYPGLSWVTSDLSSNPPRQLHKYNLRNQLASSRTLLTLSIRGALFDLCLGNLCSDRVTFFFSFDLVQRFC